jgi:hypothetical protein
MLIYRDALSPLIAAKLREHLLSGRDTINCLYADSSDFSDEAFERSSQKGITKRSF